MNPNADGNCPFCKIASGEDSSTKLICEGESWVAFFPLDPATLGHTLIVPRKHVKNLWEAEATLADELMAAAIKLGLAIEKALVPDGLNLITSAGRAAEQTVFHLHLHLVPRWQDDGFGHIWPTDGNADEEKLATTAAKIAAAYGG